MAKSLAIAYSMKKKKKGSGVHSQATSGNFSDQKGVSQAGQLVRGAHRDKDKPKQVDYNRMKVSAAKTLHREKLSELKEDDTDRKNLAKGGKVKEPAYESGYGLKDIAQEGVHHQTGKSPKGESMAGRLVRSGHKEVVKGMHKQKLQDLKSMKGPTKGRSGFAEGGDVFDGGQPAWVCSDCGSHSLTFSGHQDSSHQFDMVDSALKKRRMACGGMTEEPHDIGGSPKYAHGGEIDDDFDRIAGEMPNEFDYLSTDAGEEAEEEAKDDLVSRAMAKRKKK